MIGTRSVVRIKAAQTAEACLSQLYNAWLL